MILKSYISKLNEWGQEQKPFVFLIDFERQKPLAWSLAELDREELMFNFEGFTNCADSVEKEISFSRSPGDFAEYKSRFDLVHHELQHGNTFLVNLTSKTEILTDASLKQLYFTAQAKYRLWFKDQWVVFSPEPFLRIRGGKMETCPMKGTIDATLPNAEAVLLNDPKELAEHVTVVDLLRNDLSMFCEKVEVEKFRFTERITTQGKDLFQTSSRISGILPADYQNNIGDILLGMLPAGSVSGAPKTKTCEIIRQAEGEDRGYYTGVAGYFDGTNLNSCVLIRFIERLGDRLYYRSGGGITARSNACQEYQELIDKVYVPTAGVYQNI